MSNTQRLDLELASYCRLDSDLDKGKNRKRCQGEKKNIKKKLGTERHNIYILMYQTWLAEG